MRNKKRSVCFSLLAVAGILLGLAVTDDVLGKGKPPKGDPPPPDLPSYTITLLGTLGGDWSESRGMNQAGDIVGTSKTTGIRAHAFLYTAADGMQNLNDITSPPVNWLLIDADDINEFGQIVGRAIVDDDEDGTFDRYLSYRYTPAFGPLPEEFDELEGLRPVAINNNGDVLGTAGQLWTVDVDGDGIVEVTANLGFSGMAITDRNNGSIQVAGNLNEMAVRWTGTVSGIGTLEELGTLTSDNSGSARAFDINASGEVTGEAYAGKQKGNDNYFAFRYSDSGGMENLGALSNDRDWNDTVACALNNAGDVVGRAYFRDDIGAGFRVFLYHADFGMVNLNELVTNLPPELIRNLIRNDTDLIGITDDGHVGGTTGEGDFRQAYILIRDP